MTTFAEREFGAARLGDIRRTKRLVALADRLAADPGSSLPQALGSQAAQEGGYRFFSNPAVTLEATLVPHQQQTVLRAAELGRIAVIHDTSECRFNGEVKRRGLGRLQHQGNGQGFFAHVALAASADGRRVPLGVLGVETVFRTGPAKGKRTPAQLREDPDNESLRWRRLAKKTDDLLAGRAQAVHIMDREGDAYEGLHAMLEDSLRFVVRAAHDRTVLGPDGAAKLWAVLDGTEPILVREVPVSRRGKHPSAKENRIHPPREGRLARLTFRAASIELLRPKHSLKKLPPSLKVNVVRVWEVDCPAEVHPVEWMLITTEPIATVEDVARVVDLYRTRWLIEEYFKALKTGCAYEARQLESSHALLNALAVFIPIAWNILLLRARSRGETEAPATEVLSPVLVDALVAMRKGRLPSNPTAREAMLAIAAVGGHIKNNGAPGWLVLWRGYRDLLVFAAGWAAARGMDG